MIQTIQKLQQQLNNKFKHIAQQLVNDLDMYYFFNYVTKNNAFYNDYITITYNLIKLQNLLQNTHINSTCIANAMFNAIYYSLLNYEKDNEYRLQFFNKHKIKVEVGHFNAKRKKRITLHLTKHLKINILFKNEKMTQQKWGNVEHLNCTEFCTNSFKLNRLSRLCNY